MCIGCNKKRLSGNRSESKLLKGNPGPTGELAMFKEIWAERPHTCFITGKVIKYFSVSNFAHILPKSRYPKYRLNKDNIVLMLPEMHSLYDHFHVKIDWNKKEWKELLEMRESLKIEYNK